MMLEDLKFLFNKLLSLKKYSFLLPVLFAFTQILGYKSKISYLGYFNVSSDFYHFNLFADLVPLFLNFIIYSIVILIFFLVVLTFNKFFNNLFKDVFQSIMSENNSFTFKIKYIINNLKYVFSKIHTNFNNNYKLNDVIKKFAGIYIVILLLLLLICFLGSIDIKGIIVLSIAIFILAFISSFLYTVFSTHQTKEKFDNYYDYIFSFITLIVFILFFLGIASALGESDAKNKRTFCIINDRVMIYNYDNYAIVAPYEYIENDNSIIIDINNLKNINLENNETNYIVVKDFFRKGIDK